jgi:hypothetical protein
LGRCHDVVLKVEQLYTLKHVSDGLNSVTHNIDNCLETNKVQFGIVSKQFKQFLDQRIDNCLENNKAQFGILNNQLNVLMDQSIKK